MSALELADALYRLTHRRSDRAAFLERGPAGLSVSESCRRAFECIDPEELTAVADSIARELIMGTEVSGGLSAAFPQVLGRAAPDPAARLDLAMRFLESPAFENVRTVPFTGRGLTVEEAFYEFMMESGASAADEPVLEYLLLHEFLVALMSLRVLNSDPYFEVRTNRIRRNGHAWWAVERYPSVYLSEILRTPPSSAAGHVRYLYAAAKGRRITGVVPAYVADLLSFGTSTASRKLLASTAEAHRVAVDEVEESAQRLVSLGLLP